MLSAARNFSTLKKSKSFRDIFRLEIENRSKSRHKRKQYLDTSQEPRKAYKGHLTVENYTSMKEYILTLSDLLLDQDNSSLFKVKINEHKIEELNTQLLQKDQEIKNLKSKLTVMQNSHHSHSVSVPNFNVQNSPFFEDKEDALSQNSSLKSTLSKALGNHDRSRNLSIDSKLNSSFDNLVKTKKSGMALTSLMNKIKHQKNSKSINL